jgi:hypothetical protein
MARIVRVDSPKRRNCLLIVVKRNMPSAFGKTALGPVSWTTTGLALTR